MWDTVRRVTGKETTREYSAPAAEKLSQHFAGIFSDPAYEPPLLKSTTNQSLDEFSEYDIFLTLGSLKPIATGLDGLPVWYLRLAAPWIASQISYIYNLSYNSSVVPVQWKLSSITQVPKINKPVDFADFRPILVTPVLSRIYERYIVRRKLYSVLVHPDFSHLFHDQFAFRPTGSTTAALLALFGTTPTISYYVLKRKFTIICDNDLIPLPFVQKTTIRSGRIFFNFLVNY